MVTPPIWTRALSEPEALRRDGRFLVEGRLALERLLALEGGAARVVAVLSTGTAARALQLEARLPGRVEVRSPAEMAALTGFNFHRGVLALVERPAMLSVDTLLKAVGPALHTASAGEQLRSPGGDARRPQADHADCLRPHAFVRSVFVVLEHLVDVDNVGSCFRNARAFGASAVLLDDRCADPLYRKAVRTSMGMVLDMPWTTAPAPAIFDALQARAVTTIGLTPRADAAPLPDAAAAIDPDAPVALVVGNEGHGLSAETLARCTCRARIAMAPGADSLNVGTALAIGLFQVSNGGLLPPQV